MYKGVVAIICLAFDTLNSGFSYYPHACLVLQFSNHTIHTEVNIEILIVFWHRASRHHCYIYIYPLPAKPTIQALDDFSKKYGFCHSPVAYLRSLSHLSALTPAPIRTHSCTLPHVLMHTPTCIDGRMTKAKPVKFRNLRTA